MSEKKLTFGEALDRLNQHCHPAGYHVSMHRTELLPLEASNTPHDIIKQTYDWRFQEPDKEEYTITLTAENVKYIGRAIEVYTEALCELHIKTHLEDIVKKMCERTWVFTFGCGHEHEGHYVKIKGTFEEARAKMFERYGNAWAFQYSEEAWEEAVKSGTAHETELQEEPEK